MAVTSPSIRAVGTEVASSATGNVTVPKPAGATIGDAWYVAVFAWTAAPTPPAGFTTQLSVTQAGNRITLFRRMIDGSEGASVVFVAGGARSGYLPFLVQDVDPTTVEDITPVGTVVGSGTSIAIPSAFALSPGALDLIFVIGDMSSGLTSSSTGYTVVADGTKVHALRKALTTYGANAPTITMSGTTGVSTVAAQLVLRPANSVQYVAGPTSMPAAASVYSGGPHVLSAAGLLVPERRLPIYSRPRTQELTGVNALSRCKHPQTGSDGTYLDYTSRNYHKVLIDCFDLLVVFANYHQADTPSSLTGLGDVTFRGSMLRPANNSAAQWATSAGSSFYPIWFGKDGRDVTVKPGGYAIGRVSGDFPAGTVLFSQVRALVGSGNLPLHNLPDSSVYEGVVINAGADLTGGNTIPLGYGTVANNGAGGSAPAAIGNYTVRPVAIYAVPKGTAFTPHVPIAGDSIGDGVGRSSTFGYIEQAFELAGIPYINLSMSGELARDFGPASGHQMRGRIAGLPTAVAHEYGRNDVSNGTFAQVQGYLIASWRMWQDRGAAVHQPTITPRSTSTDGWITVGNQTTVADNAVRIQVNAWIRDGAPMDGTYAPLAVGVAAGAGVYRTGSYFHPLASWWESADLVETARDSGLWLPAAFTADGLHPGDSGHNILAAGVPTARFTAAP